MSTSFSNEWLAQREPFDVAARRLASVQLGLPAWLSGLVAGAVGEDRQTPLRVIDLACGTGANLRALVPTIGNALPGRKRAVQEWLVVDHDAALLAAWPKAMTRFAENEGHELDVSNGGLRLAGARFDARIKRQPMDLAAQLETLPLSGVTLVTTSALLDLVSAAWLDRLASACSTARAAVMFSLTVDGRIAWHQKLPDDEFVHECFAAHQQRDKGFGPALGGSAGHAAIATFRAKGYAVRSARSDWVIDGGDGSASHALMSALIDGIAAAASEQSPADIERIAVWKRRRHSLKSQSTLVIGHVDLIARPR